jgi:ABC-2 type transport system permease protein
MIDLSKLSGSDYPALGSGVWRVLLRNEWFKTRHRPAFFVTLAFFTFVHVMNQGDNFWSARSDAEQTYALPDAWASIFDGGTVLLLIFASIAVIMLVSSEFTWRTARQNVIDGLSKRQWYAGKVMLLVLIGLVFLSIQLGIGVVAALLGTDFSSLSGPIVPLSVVQTSGAILLAFISVGGLGLLLALTIRGAGPAMAVWFFWIAMGEQIVPQILGRLIPAIQPALAYLPFAAAQQATSFALFDDATFQGMIEQAEAAGRSVPELPDLAVVLSVNAGWAALFLIASYLMYQRRDL